MPLHKDSLVDQPTKRTARKVQAAAMAAPLSMLVAGVIFNYLLPEMNDPAYRDALVALLTAGFTSVATWNVGYRTRERLENMRLGDCP